MAKKAFLVTFEVTCRVCVETDGKTEEQIRQEAEELAAEIVEPDWLENVSGFEPDTSEPYGCWPGEHNGTGEVSDE